MSVNTGEARRRCNSKGGVAMPKRHSQVVASSLTARENVYPYFAATDAALGLAIKALFFFRLCTVGLNESVRGSYIGWNGFVHHEE